MKTIKEQYKEIVCGWNEERTENVTNRCTEIADEFAIGFAEWIVNASVHNERWTKISDIKKLLEIYKKKDYDTEKKRRHNS